MAATRLPAIVKLSGSFAAGGLLYAELHSGAVDEARLPSLKSLLLPTQAQALSLPFSKIKASPPHPRIRPWIALDEAGMCVKVTCFLCLEIMVYRSVLVIACVVCLPLSLSHEPLVEKQKSKLAPVCQVYPSELRLQSYWSQFRAFNLAAATCRGLVSPRLNRPLRSLLSQRHKAYLHSTHATTKEFSTLAGGQLVSHQCRLFFTYYQMIDEHFKNIRESEEEARLNDKEVSAHPSFASRTST